MQYTYTIRMSCTTYALKTTFGFKEVPLRPVCKYMYFMTHINILCLVGSGKGLVDILYKTKY